jgi:hypothetical protein
MKSCAIAKLPVQFHYADLARACTNVSRPTIKRVMGKLRAEGKIECIKSSRDEIWEKKRIMIPLMVSTMAIISLAQSSRRKPNKTKKNLSDLRLPR